MLDDLMGALCSFEEIKLRSLIIIIIFFNTNSEIFTISITA